MVNNVAIQEPMDALEDITDEQWLHTFAVNIHGFFWVTKADPHRLLGDQGRSNRLDLLDGAGVGGPRDPY